MKWRIGQLAQTVPRMIASGDAAELVGEFWARIYSNRQSFLLRRDNDLPHGVPMAKIEVLVRRVMTRDIAAILRERPARAAALKSDLQNCCFVAVTDDDQIAYMQFLIDASQNALIARDFRGLCPPLNKDEMLLEWAYTFKKFRGLGIMSHAMANISERGAERGARWLYTYVATDNVPSLKGCRNAGYLPYRLRTEHWRFGRLSSTTGEICHDPDH